MKKQVVRSLFWMAALCLGTLIQTHAQWTSQTFQLKAGWNAVYLHVDASYATLDQLVANDLNNPIREIWLWNPAPSTLQFINSPQDAASSASQWSSWVRLAGGPTSSLQRLVGNAAYLVKVDDAVPTYAWTLKGKVLAPHYDWTSSGLNFVGFPTPSGAAPTFESFLAEAPNFQRVAEIFRYVGGPMNSTNPQRVFALRTTSVNRGEAFWLRTSDNSFNRYFGPLEVALQSSRGVDFGDSFGQNRIRLRNRGNATVTVTLNLLSSEAPPAGQPALAGIPPLLVRGPINTTNLTYGYSNLVGQAQSWTLAPEGQEGSETEVILGVNRFSIGGNPGDVFAGILRFTDSFNLSQIDIPVSAQVASNGGLWLGQATVTQVRNYLKSYLKDNLGGLVLSNGQYVATTTNSSIGNVARPYPLRLIIHNPPSGSPVLLQRVYYGWAAGTSNTVVATKESLLDSGHLDTARRISATHLPFSSGNLPFPFTGQLKPGTNATVIVAEDYDDQPSNPFVHAYHPDHDNLNATFDTKLPQGTESYSIVRTITLTVTAPNDDFQSLTLAGQALVGDYGETVTLNGTSSQARTFETKGTFSLTRISNISTLTQN